MTDPKEQGLGSGHTPPPADEPAPRRRPRPARGPGQGHGNAPDVEDVDAWHHGTPPGKKGR